MTYLFPLDTINAQPFALFYVHRELDKLTSESSYFEKQKAFEKGHELLSELLEGITKERAEELLEEWNQYVGKEKVTSDYERRSRMVNKLQSLINGTPIKKTFKEWEEILYHTSISKTTRLEIILSLNDFELNLKEMEKIHGKDRLKFKKEDQSIIIYISEDEVNNIK